MHTCIRSQATCSKLNHPREPSHPMCVAGACGALRCADACWHHANYWSFLASAPVFARKGFPSIRLPISLPTRWDLRLARCPHQHVRRRVLMRSLIWSLVSCFCDMLTNLSAMTSYSRRMMRKKSSNACVLRKAEATCSLYSPESLCFWYNLGCSVQCAPGYWWCTTWKSSLSTLIGPSKMVMLPTKSSVGSSGLRKACQHQLTHASKRMFSPRGKSVYQIAN
mmetsp:Transcript_2718/g.5220  ORF Transcript_2718/g.5220 Transcript_2718/m.5220 type:complete len:223 (-) Transcript_2718:923-1591(-)